MEKLFLNKDLSLLAKEKGFDEPCFAFYDSDGFNYIQCSPENGMVSNKYHHNLAAPLYQQIIDWFKEKHGLYIRLTPLTNCWHYKIYKLKAINNPEEEIKAYSDFTDEYQQGLDKAIEEAFKLI